MDSWSRPRRMECSESGATSLAPTAGSHSVTCHGAEEEGFEGESFQKRLSHPAASELVNALPLASIGSSSARSEKRPAPGPAPSAVLLKRAAHRQSIAPYPSSCSRNSPPPSLLAQIARGQQKKMQERVLGFKEKGLNPREEREIVPTEPRKLQSGEDASHHCITRPLDPAPTFASHLSTRFLSYGLEVDSLTPTSSLAKSAAHNNGALANGRNNLATADTRKISVLAPKGVHKVKKPQAAVDRYAEHQQRLRLSSPEVTSEVNRRIEALRRRQVTPPVHKDPDVLEAEAAIREHAQQLKERQKRRSPLAPGEVRVSVEDKMQRRKSRSRRFSVEEGKGEGGCLEVPRRRRDRQIQRLLSWDSKDKELMREIGVCVSSHKWK